MRDREIDLYANPAIYELLHAYGTAAEVRVLESLEPRPRPSAAREGSRWLEPACGTGRYLQRARARGKKVCGFDASPAMVAYARRRGLDVFEASLVGCAGALGSRRFDFAFLTINTIRHLADDRAVLEHLGEIARVLAPGAVYVVGLHLSAYGRERPQTDRWEGARGSLAVYQTIRYLPPADSRDRRETVRSRIRVVRPSGEEHLRNGYDLRCYDRAEWERLLNRSAFRVRTHVDEEGMQSEPRDGHYGLWVLEPRQG